MTNLRKIDDAFVDEYIITHRNHLSKPTMGGTDWRFADIVAPAFREILEISNPDKVLEIGFNVGGSALMFLSINPELKYWSVDIQENDKSIKYLSNKFWGFSFVRLNSRLIENTMYNLPTEVDLAFVDGDHSEKGVRIDINKVLEFNPKYVLLDDYRHPSHKYIEEIVTQEYADKLEVIKIFEFNQCWKGYSMALCKVKTH